MFLEFLNVNLALEKGGKEKAHRLQSSVCSSLSCVRVRGGMKRERLPPGSPVVALSVQSDA